MPMEVLREGFAKVVGELVEQKGFAPPLSVMGVADDGSMFGVHFERIEGQLKAELVCQHVEIQFALPIIRAADTSRSGLLSSNRSSYGN